MLLPFIPPKLFAVLFEDDVRITNGVGVVVGLLFEPLPLDESLAEDVKS
jgi:hypothetical protein